MDENKLSLIPLEVDDTTYDNCIIVIKESLALLVVGTNVVLDYYTDDADVCLYRGWDSSDSIERVCAFLSFYVGYEVDSVVEVDAIIFSGFASYFDSVRKVGDYN